MKNSTLSTPSRVQAATAGHRDSWHNSEKELLSQSPTNLQRERILSRGNERDTAAVQAEAAATKEMAATTEASAGLETMGDVEGAAVKEDDGTIGLLPLQTELLLRCTEGREGM